jgi:hypothetical protein
MCLCLLQYITIINLSLCLKTEKLLLHDFLLKSQTGMTRYMDSKKYTPTRRTYRRILLI